MTWRPDEELQKHYVDRHINEVKRYYATRLSQFQGLVRVSDHEDRKTKMRSANARCNACVANSVMRAVRDNVVLELARAAEIKVADMTLTLARHLVEEILERSVDDRLLLDVFATKGRTAGTKTKNTVGDFDSEISILKVSIANMRSEMLLRRTPLRLENSNEIKSLAESRGL
jgi:hypothetical protein|tara:strand:+ start:12996 stop:13514 length:519 start_codon:yes stop_codon:yes gene_type:complete